MSKKIDLDFSFSSSTPMELLKAICRDLKPFNQRLPTVSVDYSDECKEMNDWIDKFIPKCEFSVMADWGDVEKGEYNEGWISYKPHSKIIKIQISDYELTDAESVMKMLAPLPWNVASFRKITRKNGWKEHDSSLLGGSHFPVGWACAFKGKGHNRLVSRRWLEYHPWHLIRDEENDISFIQFHDLEAEPATALLQAEPGHDAMDWGFIDKTHPFSTHPQKIYFDRELRGIYVHDTQNLRVVIPAGQTVTNDLMYDYCAGKYYQICEEGLIETISFVFIVAAEAEPYLYDLWLRNIECFGFTEQGEEIRLDEDYQPTYEHPEWVKQLRQKQQQQEQQAKLDRVTTRLSQIKTEMKRLDDRIKNLSGGSYDRALHTRIKELKAKSSKLIGEKNQLEREKADLEQEINQNNHK